MPLAFARVEGWSEFDQIDYLRTRVYIHFTCFSHGFRNFFSFKAKDILKGYIFIKCSQLQPGDSNTFDREDCLSASGVGARTSSAQFITKPSPPTIPPSTFSLFLGLLG